MQPLADEAAQTARQLKAIEERRKWAVEQACKLVPAADQVIAVARSIDNFVAGRMVTGAGGSSG
ncbi:MAG: hypothetical protein KGL39_12360 [Patescibacteria group bacterium]|nr:hypothetical protein [Patescibacteria group bacterium]